MRKILTDDFRIRPEICPGVGRKLDEYRTFECGWNFGDGVPFSGVVLERIAALSRLGMSRGLHGQDCFPGLNGEILLVFYSGASSQLEVTANKDQSFDVLEERDGSVVDDCCGLTFEDVCKRIGNWDGRQWTTFAPSILNTTMTSKERGSPVSPWVQEATKAYPSFR